ncbi:GNAT family N-acetyltransferase [Aquincola sp. S2]|uniref:GNAT family N-acetyltransferase n=1 Tax=Pseudaquabacterium terrae TaxID=2732868 RepID=A0ABX2EGX3_9BURK|nr:GNAT family N-acetyltransferase [Aquabacterium terrae]NRF67868.1 GNAT family N-acetyltransferase [Aquabacterium terrae]
MPLEISPFTAADRAGWEPLARGYKAFYRTEHTDAQYEATWQRLLAGTQLIGLAARRDGRMLGIAHAFFHPTVWASDALYLQDLFVDEAARGQGIAAALIEVLAGRARAANVSRYYWNTHHENARARALYDRVARWHGFIRYDVALNAG